MQRFPAVKAQPYVSKFQRKLGSYDPKLRDPLVLENPKNGKRLVVGGDIIVDSGASGLSLAAGVAKKAKKKIGPLSVAVRPSMTAAGKVLMPVLKGVAYCVGKSCVKGDVGVNFSGETLLGMDFLETASCQIDFKKRRMVCSGQEFKIGPRRFGVFKVMR